ncbi:MAG: glycerophosphodiester phosphodiesterase [Faecalibacterium prausnitzii]
MTPQIIAHRGASYLAPENTLTAFKKAMEIGADGVEMDVQQTIDAGLVIHHDYMIDLHTDISGKIYDMTMGDLKELDFGSWKDAIYQDEKIATLQEAMELCKQMPECTVHLELKSTMDNDPDFVPRVLEVLRQTEMVEQVMPCFLQPRAAAAGKAAAARTAGRCTGIRRAGKHAAAAAHHLEGSGTDQRYGGHGSHGCRPAGERSRRGKLQLDDPLDDR